MFPSQEWMQKKKKKKQKTKGHFFLFVRSAERQVERPSKWQNNKFSVSSVRFGIFHWHHCLGCLNGRGKHTHICKKKGWEEEKNVNYCSSKNYLSSSRANKSEVFLLCSSISISLVFSTFQKAFAKKRCEKECWSVEKVDLLGMHWSRSFPSLIRDQVWLLQINNQLTRKNDNKMYFSLRIPGRFPVEPRRFRNDNQFGSFRVHKYIEICTDCRFNLVPPAVADWIGWEITQVFTMTPEKAISQTSCFLFVGGASLVLVFFCICWYSVVVSMDLYVKIMFRPTMTSYLYENCVCFFLVN